MTRVRRVLATSAIAVAFIGTAASSALAADVYPKTAPVTAGENYQAAPVGDNDRTDAAVSPLTIGWGASPLTNGWNAVSPLTSGWGK